MKVLAIDPGTEQSAYVLWDGVSILDKGIVPNRDILYGIYEGRWVADACYIEQVASYGMAVGETTFRTVYWYGRFAEAWYVNSEPAQEAALVPRKEIVRHHCFSNKATDANVRQALIDRIGPQGKKKEPGPTFGISSHTWSALAIAVYAVDKGGRL